LKVCEMASAACSYAHKLMQQAADSELSLVQCQPANKAVVQLSAGVLTKLLSEHRRLPGGTEPSTSSSSNSNTAISSSGSELQQSCQLVAKMMGPIVGRSRHSSQV
jgi:hypothetical protein